MNDFQKQRLAEQTREAQKPGTAATSGLSKSLPGAGATSDAPSKRRSSTWLVASALAVGVAGAAAMMFGTGGAPAVDAPLSAQQQQTRISTFQAQGPLRLPGVSSADQAAAIRSLALPAGDQQALERDIQSGQVWLVSVTLWDDMVEDGDVVEVISGGFNKTVALTKARQTIVVPVPASNMVQIRGVRDGGGGITVATATSSGALPIPVLAPGQVVSVPVAR